MYEKYPLKLIPAYKDYIWGGEKINSVFSKNIDVHPLAETWECSVHPDGLSIVANGVYKGKTLREVLEEHPEYTGGTTTSSDGFPLLVKIIDANKPLSVQVHPDDKYAFECENGQRGKTEMWHILDCAPDSYIICGFKKDVQEEELRESINDGSVEELVHKISVKKGDTVLVEAGQVHAIGAGILLVEIQESSNLTYRVYDYNRVDSSGNRRELHIDKALDIINKHMGGNPLQERNIISKYDGYRLEQICADSHFCVYSMEVNSDKETEILTEIKDGFSIMLCTEGNGEICWEDQKLELKKGECVFIPDGMSPLFSIGNYTILVAKK